MADLPDCRRLAGVIERLEELATRRGVGRPFDSRLHKPRHQHEDCDEDKHTDAVHGGTPDIADHQRGYRSEQWNTTSHRCAAGRQGGSVYLHAVCILSDPGALMTTNDGTLGRYLRWFLAALSLGAGVIHFAVSGGHFDVSWKHGLFFAVVAWLQLSWAAAVIVKPTPRVLALGALGNTVVLGTWVMSRVWGVPVGPNAWTPESVSLADALATGFEAGIVLISLAVLVRPALAQRSIRPSYGFVGIGLSGLAVAVISTVALVPSFASVHHGAGNESTAAHSTPAGGGEAPAKGHTNSVISADGTSACEQAGVANEGNSGHGERGPVPFEPLDTATREQFAAQVQLANDVVARYPTVKDAEAAGWKRTTPYVPCIAAHYLKGSAFATGFAPSAPEITLSEGTEPDSKIVGLSYLQFADPDKAPDGFAGPNDPWHVHRQLCIGKGGVLGDENTTAEKCEARGGKVQQLDNLWMNHMWNVPGWESRWGLFSSEHPDLGGRIGDINGTPQPKEDLDESNAKS